MNKLMVVGLMGVALAGCVGTSVPADPDCDDVEQSAIIRYAYPNVRIDKLFGLNDEVLANTNLFAATSNSWHHYKLSLGKNEGGFTACSVHLEREAKTGRLALEYVALDRTLKPGADETELLKESCKAIEWLNDNLGTDMELERLADLQAMRTCLVRDRTRLVLPLCHTSVYAELAEGQQVHIAAHDASFMKRNGEYVEMSPASIEITFRIRENEGVRRLKLGHMRDKMERDGTVVAEVSEQKTESVQGVSISMDLSEKLSKVIRAQNMDRPRKARPAGGKKSP